jgi:hypothetical protein
MKRAIKIFVILAIIFGGFTAYQFLGRTTYQANKVIMKPMKLEKAERRLPHPPPPTAAEIRVAEQQAAKERAEAEAELRKEKREDLKLYLGFGTTILSSLVSIILAIINRKKD